MARGKKLENFTTLGNIRSCKCHVLSINQVSINLFLQYIGFFSQTFEEDETRLTDVTLSPKKHSKKGES